MADAATSAGANAPIGPLRDAFPIANSHRSSGIDHEIRKIAHGTRNAPPPFVAAIRGKRQMFPVPTAIPSIAMSIAQRLEKPGLAIVTGGRLYRE